MGYQKIKINIVKMLIIEYFFFQLEKSNQELAQGYYNFFLNKLSFVLINHHRNKRKDNYEIYFDYFYDFFHSTIVPRCSRTEKFMLNVKEKHNTSKG